MKLKICLAIFAVITVIAFKRPTAASPVRPESDAVLYTSAPTYIPLAWMQAGERFPDGAALYMKDAKGARKLFTAFAATSDANVSFDGSRLLFAGKRQRSDPWQIWEASFADLEPRLVISTPSDAVRPFYLPGNRIVYSVKQNGKFVLFNSSQDGSDPKQISFSAENVLASDVLRDGRILVTSAYPGQSGMSPEIFAVYSDGSGFESIRCDHAPSRYFGRELESGNIVFTHGERLAAFTSALATEIDASIPSGRFAGDVAETSAHEWTVATDSNGKYVLKMWKPGSSASSVFASMANENLVQPVVKRPRAVPKKHPSALHDWNYANLLALNVYTSKVPLAPGSVASVRIYTQGIGTTEKLLGSSTVEADGSFFVRVPGDIPIKFELLDSKGNSLQREKGWYWSRAGEQRICVGCHSGPERAPENVVPAVLEKSTEPVDMTPSVNKQMGEQ